MSWTCDHFEPLEARWMLSSAHKHARPNAEPQAVPAAPTQLTASIVADGSGYASVLQFQDNSTDERGIIVERSVGGRRFRKLTQLSGSDTTGMRYVVDHHATLKQTIQYRVKAIDDAGASAYDGPVVATLSDPSSSPPRGKNLLFFGNSFTYTNDAPDLVRDLAVANGKPAPTVFTQAAAGWTLHDHLAKIAADGSANIIDASLPAGQSWDDVVVQENSTRATNVSASPVYGDLAGFRADAAALVADVRASSPAAHAVLFETWARGPMNSLYPVAFTGPADMQAQILSNYRAAAHDIKSAEVADAGEAFAAANWSRDLYNGDDEYHPSGRGSLLAAMVLYRTIYHEDIADAQIAAIQADLTALGLSAGDFAQLAALADAMPVGQ
jgi:hypothetical protein